MPRMNNRHGLSYAVWIISIAFFLIGCGGPTRYLRPDAKIGTVEKIAVLPLENFSRDDYAAERMRTQINNELLLRGIEPSETGEVSHTLREFDVRSLGTLTDEDIRKIGKALNVQGVMMGSVGAYGISRGITASYPEVSLQLSLYDVAGGKVLWSAWHTAGGPNFWTRHFGTDGDTLSEAAARAVKEILDTYKMRLTEEIEQQGETIWGP